MRSTSTKWCILVKNFTFSYMERLPPRQKHLIKYEKLCTIYRSTYRSHECHQLVGHSISTCFVFISQVSTWKHLKGVLDVKAVDFSRMWMETFYQPLQTRNMLRNTYFVKLNAVVRNQIRLICCAHVAHALNSANALNFANVLVNVVINENL